METEIDDFYMDPYDCDDPANEPRPISVVYTAGFRALQELNKKATSLLREPLESSKFQNGITKGLIKEIAKRTKEDTPAQVKFAIVGDMSAGKSSLLNSILSIGTIARKGDGGDSCTWVVQRYQKMFPEQSSPFAAKVRFFNIEEIRSTIGDLLAKYYRSANKDIKEEEDGDGEKGDSLVIESFGDMQDTISAYTALFCEHPEFATEEAANSFLGQARSENDPMILDTLVKWANAVVEEYLNGKTALLVENSTTDGLLWDLQPFTYQLGGPEGQGLIAPWPLVSAVEFGLDHPLLNEGIVFVDSPGLSDANSSRSKNATMSHRECTHKIIVAEIGRAEANEAVRKNLQAGSRTRGSSHMLLVLTRGDSIDPKTDVSGTPTEKRRIDKLEINIDELQAKKQEKQQERRRARDKQDREDLAEEIQSLLLDVRRLTAERESCRVEMRNRKVVIKMQTLYKGLTSDPKQLATFAVGNQAYQQHVAGFSDEDRPHMSVKQTNIPALRHKLYMMPIQGRLNDTMHLTEIQLPNLVNTMELYCAQLHLARKSEIEAIVLAPKKLLPAVVHESFEVFKIAVLEVILTPMKENESEWIKQAKRCSRAWTEKFKGQLAIFKGEGCKKAQRGKNNGKPINWNDELLEIGGDPLEKGFNACFRKMAASSWSKDLTSDLVKLIDNTRRDIKRDSNFHPLALEPFFNTFNGQSRNFDPLVRSCKKVLRNEISNILERATTQSHDDFITVAMKQIYRDAAQIKGGKGAPIRRAKYVETALSKRPGVWSQVHDAIEVAFDKLFESAEKTMVAKFGEVFDALHNNFCLLCDDAEAKDDDEKLLEQALRDDLREKTAEVKAMLADDGAIAKLVAECKAYQATQAEAAKDPSSLFVQQ